MEFDYLLIGGGLASASAAESLRREGAKGTIALISAEDILPYHRPPLSKKFLINDMTSEKLLVYNKSFYKNHKIKVLLGTRVINLYPKEKIVETDNQGSIRYQKLLIATGSRINKLTVPGSDLHGIYYLRTFSDAEAIKRATSYSRKAVVVGSGFIGMELASAFRREGIQTTIISKGENIFEGLDSQEISTFFESYYKKQGVEIVLGDTVKEFQGTHHVNGVLTTKGMFMPCDIVAVGIGVTPDTGFLETSGILLNDGIVVDEYMQTNYNEIFAAGDVTRFYDTVFGQYRRVEHWDNAAKQGKIAAKNMLGSKVYYNEVSYFFSDVFDLSFGFLGYTKDTNERIIRGSFTDQSFTVYYLRDGILSGAFLLNRPNSEEEVARNLIQNRANLENNKTELPEITLPFDKVAGSTAH